MGSKARTEAYYSSWDDGIYGFSSDSRYVSDISFKVFINGARIQIHGCNTERGLMPGNRNILDRGGLRINLQSR